MATHLNPPFFALLLTLCAGSTAAAQEIRLEPVWVRVGDAFGEEDQENARASVESAEFSPGDSLVVTGSKRGFDVRVWRVGDGALVWERKHDEEVEAVAFSRDGRYVASGGEDNRVRIWEAATGEPVTVLDHPASIDGLRFSHEGGLLVTGSEAGQLILWRTSDWAKLHTEQVGPDEQAGGPQGVHADINSIDFTTNDGELVAASRVGAVVRYAITADTTLRYVTSYTGHRGSIKTTRISPDGRFVAAGAGSGSGVIVWDFDTAEVAMQIPATGMIMEAVEFTPDGAYLLTGGNEGEGAVGAPVENPGFENNDGFGHIRAYRVPQEAGGAFELALEEPVFRQEYLHFSADGSMLVTAHEDGTVRLWKVTQTGESATPVEEGADVPEGFGLRGPFPNPARATTSLLLDLPGAAQVRADVYDLTGRRVLAVPARPLPPGRHALDLDAAPLGAGVYVYRVAAETAAGTDVRTGRIVRLR